MTDTLKPCPFCSKSMTASTNIGVTCLVCQYTIHNEAEWNTRATLTEHFPEAANALDEASLMRELLEEFLVVYESDKDDDASIDKLWNDYTAKVRKVLKEATDD